MLSLTKIYNEFLQKTLSFLESRYSLEKIPKKLKNFTELDFNNFKKSIKIKKISLKDEEELMSWFTKKCETLSALKLELSALDREIDDMVFDLYGLTEEEKEVVLSN